MLGIIVGVASVFAIAVGYIIGKVVKREVTTKSSIEILFSSLEIKEVDKVIKEIIDSNNKIKNITTDINFKKGGITAYIEVEFGYTMQVYEKIMKDIPKSSYEVITAREETSKSTINNNLFKYKSETNERKHSK